MATVAQKKAAEALAAAPDTDKWVPTGASAKLAFIQAHIGYVKKTGTNSHMKFDYFQEHGILELVRQFQRDLHVLIHTTFPTEPVVNGNLMTGFIKVMLVDCDIDPESSDRAVWATYPCQATDNAGWGAAKLLTYGKKTALQKFLGIPAEELAEAEQEMVEIALGVERPIGSSAPETVAELRKALTDGKADPTRVKGKLAADFQCQSIEGLLPAQVPAFKAWVLEETAKLTKEG